MYIGSNNIQAGKRAGSGWVNRVWATGGSNGDLWSESKDCELSSENYWLEQG